MTQIRIPPVQNGAVSFIDATVDIRLITADGKPCIAFHTTNLATEYQALSLPADPRGLTIALAPQSALAMPGSVPTWYDVTIRVWHIAESYRIQVPDSPAVLELRDLISAGSIDPADILAGRLLPDPAAVADGDVLTVADGTAVWAEPAAGGAGSEVHTITADLVLSAASASHQIISSDVPFVRVLLPNATTLAVGDQFTIDNIGSDNKVLANSSGTSLGMITVGSSVICTVASIVTPDDGWVIDYRANNPVIVSLMSPSIAMPHSTGVVPDLLPLSASKSLYSYAYYEPSLEGYAASFVVLDTSGENILFSDAQTIAFSGDDQHKYVSCALSDSQAMYVETGGYITVVGVTGNVVAYIASANSPISTVHCLVALSATRAVLFGVSGIDDMPCAAVVSFVNGVITCGTIQALDFGWYLNTTKTMHGSVINATSILLKVHMLGSSPYLGIIDVAGDTISLGQHLNLIINGMTSSYAEYRSDVGYIEATYDYSTYYRRGFVIANDAITMGVETSDAAGLTQFSVLDDASKIFSVWQSSGLRAQKYLIDPTPITGGVTPSGAENRFSLDTVTILAMARYSARSVLILDSAYNLRSLVMM